MCSGSKGKSSLTNLVMEGEIQKQKEGFFSNSSILLEFSASDDLISFKHAVEEKGFDVNEASFWYGRVIGSRKMGLEERTPLMMAAMFGSVGVLNYILSMGQVDVNRAYGSDGATALHCAVAGGSLASLEIVKLLLDASADANSVDANGNRPCDLIVQLLNPAWNLRKKRLEMMLNGSNGLGEGWVSSDEIVSQLKPQKDGSEKKEYPIDLSMPDIKNGIYGTDEFRMYTFKVKPCSRAYSHDWTECPFVHPGENARRRDPRKYHYSCVPCPEFRKGTCRHGDACEYAHGVFECWLHPAQYRTRLCKDETGCTRRVCFFAHKPEELRPLYPSTGSAVPSPRSSSTNMSSLDMSMMNSLGLGSPSVLMLPTSTPPMSPSAATSSPMGGAMWQNQSSLVPPTLQLPSSRLKTAMSARDMELELDLLGLEDHHHHQQLQLLDAMSNISSQSNWANSLAALAASSGGRSGEYSRLDGVNPTNLEDVFGSLDPSLLSQLQALTPKSSTSHMNSPTGIQLRQNMNQKLRSSYPTNLSSSPARTPTSFGLDPSGAKAAAIMNSRSAAFAKRSQSFIDRGAVNHHHHLGITTPTSSATNMQSTLSDWGSPGGKLDWGVQGEELNKLRKSASFGFRSNHSGSNIAAMDLPASMTTTMGVDKSDVSWAPMGEERFGLDEQQQQYHLNSGGLEILSSWAEQLYMEQEQMVA